MLHTQHHTGPPMCKDMSQSTDEGHLQNYINGLWL